MWILSQDKKQLINANTVSCLELQMRGNVGVISASYKAIPNELGEYRDYAAKKIFEEIALLLSQNNTYFMPDEFEANEKYKEIANEQ